jgi:hypothetical protein
MKRSVPSVNNFKLRVSYGSVGNNANCKMEYSKTLKMPGQKSLNISKCITTQSGYIRH